MKEISSKSDRRASLRPRRRNQAAQAPAQPQAPKMTVAGDSPPRGLSCGQVSADDVHTPISKTHDVGMPTDAPNGLLSPPLSLASVSRKSAKAQSGVKPTIFRKPTLPRRRTLRNHGKVVGEDGITVNDLPEGMRAILEKESAWIEASAKSDYLLALPRPGHKYVDGRKRVVIGDSRFVVPYKGVRTDESFRTAGIPSDKPYAPNFKAGSLPAKRSTPHSSEDPGLLEVANNVLQEEAFHTRPSIKLIIPDSIKALLVDDWENVTKNTQLVPIPHPKPVTKIIDDYSAYEMPKRLAGSSHADILEETLCGLKEYFDKSLGRILLYKFERPQYAEVYKKLSSADPEFQGKAASDIYGAEHLCRLIVSLPELIAQTNMDQQSVNRLREELAKFCTWLSKNTTEYFVNGYETPAPDYIDKAKN